MPYNAPASAVAGTVATAAFVNTNYRDNIIALYAGAKSVTGQAAGDVFVASSATQEKRLAIGTPGYALIVNAGGTDVEWGEVTTFLPGNAVRIAMGL